MVVNNYSVNHVNTKFRDLHYNYNIFTIICCLANNYPFYNDLYNNTNFAV